jgi:hypothetical protein
MWRKADFLWLCPAKSCAALVKKPNVERAYNDHDFGRALIASSGSRFMDGRTELYDEKFFVDHNAASSLMGPDDLRLLVEYKIDATLMRTQSAPTRLLDHVESIMSTDGGKYAPTTSPPSICATLVPRTLWTRRWNPRRDPQPDYRSN